MPTQSALTRDDRFADMMGYPGDPYKATLKYIGHAIPVKRPCTEGLEPEDAQCLSAMYALANGDEPVAPMETLKTLNAKGHLLALLVVAHVLTGQYVPKALR